MTYTVSPQEASWNAPAELSSSPSRRLLTVIAGAVLLVLGVLIGCFMVRNDAPADLEDSHAELAALRAEVDLLKTQSVQATTRAVELEHLLATQGSRLTHEQAQLRAAVERENFIRQAIEQSHADRQVCLNELRQYGRQPTGVPTTDVIRFAESMFERQSNVLASLANGEPVPATRLDLPALSLTAHARTQPVLVTTRTQTPPVDRPRPSEPTLASPAPTPAEPFVRAERCSTGVFFTPPQRRQQGMTFISPRPASRVASQPKSGMRFTDASDADAGPSFR